MDIKALNKFAVDGVSFQLSDSNPIGNRVRNNKDKEILVVFDNYKHSMSTNLTLGHFERADNIDEFMKENYSGKAEVDPKKVSRHAVYDREVVADISWGNTDEKQFHLTDHREDGQVQKLVSKSLNTLNIVSGLVTKRTDLDRQRTALSSFYMFAGRAKQVGMKKEKIEECIFANLSEGKEQKIEPLKKRWYQSKTKKYDIDKFNEEIESFQKRLAFLKEKGISFDKKEVLNKETVMAKDKEYLQANKKAIDFMNHDMDVDKNFAAACVINSFYKGFIDKAAKLAKLKNKAREGLKEKGVIPKEDGKSGVVNVGKNDKSKTKQKTRKIEKGGR